jgi:hypothetical protein
MLAEADSILKFDRQEFAQKIRPGAAAGAGDIGLDLRPLGRLPLGLESLAKPIDAFFQREREALVMLRAVSHGCPDLDPNRELAKRILALDGARDHIRPHSEPGDGEAWGACAGWVCRSRLRLC